MFDFPTQIAKLYNYMSAGFGITFKPVDAKANI